MTPHTALALSLSRSPRDQAPQAAAGSWETHSPISTRAESHQLRHAAIMPPQAILRPRGPARGPRAGRQPSWGDAGESQAQQAPPAQSLSIPAQAYPASHTQSKKRLPTGIELPVGVQSRAAPLTTEPPPRHPHTHRSGQTMPTGAMGAWDPKLHLGGTCGGDSPLTPEAGTHLPERLLGSHHAQTMWGTLGMGLHLATPKASVTHSQLLAPMGRYQPLPSTSQGRGLSQPPLPTCLEHPHQPPAKYPRAPKGLEA